MAIGCRFFEMGILGKDPLRVDAGWVDGGGTVCCACPVNAAPRLAGRLVELRAVLDAVGRGAPVSAGALVTGEAGVGKSRLVAEAALQANVPFITGWCLRTSSGLPFLPIVDILRGLHDLDEGLHLESILNRCPSFVRDEVAALLPELGSAGPHNQPSLEGWRRHRLFDSIRRVFDGFARQAPVVVVIEDVHWADSSTLDLLDYLLAGGRRVTLPIVLTCRMEETDPRALESFLNRDGLVRVDLEPLTRAQTREQLLGLVGEHITDTWVDEIYRRTGGNAFFTEQLSAAAVDRTGTPLTAGLRAVLLARISDAEPDERVVLAVLAVSDWPMTEADLAEVRGWTMRRVRDGLRGLLERRLVNADQNSYTLRHVLLGEAVSAQLLAGERMELHSSLAERLVERNDPSLAAATAEHFSNALRQVEELRWRVRAAEHAETVLASVEALAHWRRVIALWDSVEGPTGITALSLSEVLLRTATVADYAGQRIAAQQLADRALATSGGSATTLHRARIFGTIGELSFPFAMERATAALREADRLYETLPSHREHAWVLHQLALTLFRGGDWDYSELVRLLQHALVVAERCDARGLSLKARAHLAYLTAVNGDAGLALVQIEDVLTLEPDSRDAEQTAGALAWATTLLCFGLARYERAVEVARGAMEWIADHGHTTSFNANVIEGNALEALRELGRIEEATDLEKRRQVDSPPSAGHGLAWTLIDRALLACDAGHIKDAVELWEQCETVLQAMDETPFTGSLFTGGAETLVWAEQPARAADLVIAVIRARVDTAESRECGRAFTVGMRAVADMGVRGRLLADSLIVDSADRIAAELRDLLARCCFDPFNQPAMPPTAACESRAWTAECSRFEGTSDIEAWNAAARGWEQLGAPVRAGYARYRQAEARLAAPGGRRAT
jgi:tetratricopeptide (TPR) repeat protein